MRQEVMTEGLVTYNLELKSRSKKGRTEEALLKLAALYPYDITNKNIFIKESGQKGSFTVFINNSGFEEKKLNYKKIGIIALVAAVSLIFSCLILQKTLKNRAYVIAEQKRLEAEEKKKIEAQKELKTKLTALEEKWSILEDGSFSKVFNRLQIIYSLLPRQTVIEQLNIDGDTLNMEVTIGDSTKVLSSFEESKNLSNVKLSRASVNDKKDVASISGNFIRKTIRAENTESLENQILFYEGLINAYEHRKELQQNTNISEYISNIRSCLHKNGCSEQYVQVKGEKENLNVEVFVLSSAKSLLNFLSEIQSGEENLFDIKSFHLRNSENQTKLQSVILFNSGINIKEKNDFESIQSDIEKITSSEISTVLYKKSTPKIASPKNVVTEKKTFVNTKKLRSLSYIGLSAVNGERFVIAKDEEMNVIYKLPVTDSERNGNFCLDDGSGVYKAKIKNEWYEVKR